MCFNKIVTKTLSFNAEIMDNIESLKQKIYKKGSIHPVRQYLFFKRRESKNTLKLHKSNVQVEDTLLLHFHNSRDIKIYIRTKDSEIGSFDVGIMDTIRSLKQKIKDKEGISMHYQVLFFKGRELHDDRTFHDYNIQNEDSLQLFNLKSEERKIYIMNLDVIILSINALLTDTIK